MESKKAKLLLWLPRVLALIFAVVLVVFSRDVIVSGANFKDIAVDLFMRNIPALIIIAIIIVSWSYEITGGLAFVLVGFTHMIKSVIDHNQLGMKWYIALAWSLLLASPAISIGGLYLVNWFKRPKTAVTSEENSVSQMEENEVE